jgi:signal transduction histidine kinase
MHCKKSIMIMHLFIIGAISFSFSQTATEKDAIAMVDKAVKYVEVNGKEKAFAAFQDTAGQFIKGELYIFAYDLNGICLSQGQKPKLVGKSRIDVEDVNGKKYIQEMVELAKAKGSGWVDYMFQNPETKKIEPKTTYLIKIKDADYFVACGIYKTK